MLTTKWWARRFWGKQRIFSNYECAFERQLPEGMRGWRRGLKPRPFNTDSEAEFSQAARPRVYLVVILQAQMRDHFLALQVAQRVLQLHRLNEQVVLWIEPGHGHG